jgi:hypothetical protein
MESGRETADGGGQKPKRRYQPPEIRRLGTVRELTLSSGPSNAVDSVPTSSSKTFP